MSADKLTPPLVCIETEPGSYDDWALILAAMTMQELCSEYWRNDAPLWYVGIVYAELMHRFG